MVPVGDKEIMKFVVARNTTLTEEDIDRLVEEARSTQVKYRDDYLKVQPNRIILMAIQIISLIITLAAVIVGPLVTYKVTKRNLEFQFRTLIQEKWIDKLEEDVTKYLTQVVEWIEKYRAIIDGSSKIEEPEREIDRMLATLNSSIIKLQLHLNTNKPFQKEILSNVSNMKAIINSKSFEDESINSLKNSHEEIITNMKAILQEERSKITKIFK